MHWLHLPECPRSADPEAEAACTCNPVAHERCCPACREAGS